MKKVHIGIVAGMGSTLMLPAAAFADGQAAGGAEILIPKLAEFIPALVIFLIIMLLLSKFAWPKVLAVLKAREETIQDSIDEAAEIKERVRTSREEADAAIVEARRKASEIVLAARADVEKERGRIVAEAHKEAEDILAKARERAADEQHRIYANATDSIAKVSVAVAGKIVDEVLDANDEKQRELIKKYITEVGSLK
ncbi:F0F1 ATP synthase subunit B [Collinsella sp. AGMB00827]|uniref:ATP synthase subunit b n=1 Tax=Collinsella ureilytica TaxID=2869515 RepID=A0ABS7MJP2_9ACTN|nr:F0F1 ATP synthase subunit B [Collinsella urealyticum]MBY4797589.1 F0F1 ATP synthase subunit B [Collinsella urealyticum]